MGTERKMVDSGVEWIGEVPSEWRVEKLSGLVQETSNKNRDMKENNLLSLSYGRIVRKDIESNQGLLPQSFEGYNIVSPGDVVLRLTDLQNDQRSLRTALVTERGIITSAYTTISAPAMEAKYFAYAMNACDSSKVFYRLGGGVRQSMRFQDIKQILIPIPDSFEQQSIATFLDHHVDLIDRERELIAQKVGLLKDKRKALIFECVTGKRTIVEAQHLACVDDWTDIVGSGPLVAMPTAGHDDPFVKGGRLVDSGVDWIGEVPEGWNIEYVKDVAHIQLGKMLTPEPSALSRPTKYFRSANVTGSSSELKEMYATQPEIIKNQVVPGDILVSEGGSIGYPRILSEQDIPVEGAIIQNSVHRLRFSGGQGYGYWVCVAAYDSGAYLEATNSVSICHLTKEKLSKFQIPQAPTKIQQIIATFLDRQVGLIDREIDLLETKSSLLADKRKALIFEAVTGKIDCTQP